jgi:DNA ligase 1
MAQARAAGRHWCIDVPGEPQMAQLTTLTRRTVLGWLAAPLAGPTRADAPGTRLGVMAAREAPLGINPDGWLVSEKLDGVRAIWDGQSLRFRSGLPIAAPAWFVKPLPAGVALDGELWIGRGRFEPLSGAVRKAVPVDAEWRTVQYQLFDLPGGPGPFGVRAARLQAVVQRAGTPVLAAAEQHRLPDAAALQRRLDEVVRAGGEGLMLHRADALWHPGRSGQLLKLKPLHDAEATVIGHAPGRGRHAGRLGALRVRTDEGTEFLIGTGLSDAEREHPPPLGSVVTYTHRGHTESGVPRFASFLRVRQGV